MADAKRPIAVMLSGGGRTLVNLSDRIAAGELPAQIALVIASRYCPGAERARERGIPTIVRPGDIPAAEVERAARDAGAAFLVLAGYLRRVQIPLSLAHRIINIHPALLPGFGGAGLYGEKVHEAVLAAGCKISGCTAHLCDDKYDTGPIVMQASCPVLDTDTPATLAARVFELECDLYPRAVRALIEGRIRVSPDGRRRYRLAGMSGHKGTTLVMCAACAVAALAQPAPTARPQKPSAPAPQVADGNPGEDAKLAALRRDADAALAKGDLPAARDALTKLAAEAPLTVEGSPALHYNLACVHARLGERAEALASLETALSLGFVNLNHLTHDPDLASLRGEQDYRLIVAGWRDLLDARGEADLESWKEALGKGYSFARDDKLRLNIASSFDERSTSEARHEVEVVAKWAAANLFGADAIPPDGADNPRPPHWVTLVLPTPAHFAKFVPAQGVGGVYDFDRRILVAQELGASLRHEFLHVLHHRVMNRLGQSHAWWAQEGLGSLVEDLSRPDAAGAVMPVASWRTNIAKRLEARNALTPWKTLFATPHDRFMVSRPIANYSQARAIFLYLSDRGRLRDWLEAYEATFNEDPTGVAAMEKCFARPLAATEKDFRLWLRALPLVAEELRPGMPTLGVTVGQGTGEGPVVEEIAPRGASAKQQPESTERLRLKDIITSVAGEATRTAEDLVRVLSEHEVGERVQVAVRRGTRRIEVPVVLRAQEANSP